VPPETRPKVAGEKPTSTTVVPFFTRTWNRPVMVEPVVLCVLMVSGTYVWEPSIVVLSRAVFSTWMIQ
jgi:hypothetical protein